MTVAWIGVAGRIRHIAADGRRVLDDGQRATLRWIADAVLKKGSIVADEVGTGKTRIACAIAEAVLSGGGRVAVVVPPGLMHQWAQEWRKLQPECSDISPKRITTFPAFVSSIVEETERTSTPASNRTALQSAIDRAFPRPLEPELWLISHNLRAPLVRIRGDDYRHRKWQQALPSFVHAQLARGDSARDARTRAGLIARHMSSRSESEDGSEWAVVDAIAIALADEIDGRSDLAKGLGELPLLNLREGSDNRALAEAFQKGGKARDVFERLLGSFLGRFDLLIVDEAHKSRGGFVDLSTETMERSNLNVLTRLLERLLLTNDDSRRLGLTATPLELSGDDWEPLLTRTMRGPMRYDVATVAKDGSAAARELNRAARELRCALDAEAPEAVPEAVLDAVCAAGKRMTAVLKPHVTRRRRTDDDLYGAFRSRLLETPSRENLAMSNRLHRRISAAVIKVGFEGGTSNAANDNAVDQDAARLWTRVMFSMESLGQALRGYARRSEASAAESAVERWLETAYTRLAAGHISPNQSGEKLNKLLPEPDESTARRRHRERITYWLEQQDAALTELRALKGALGDPLWSHPRVVCAVELIESFTKTGNKVLVFGTFHAPMRALSRVLEVRHALRSLVAGKPVAVALADSGELAMFELERMRRSGLEVGQINNRAELELLWRKSNTAYTRFRESVRRAVRAEVRSWLEEHGIGRGSEVATLKQKLERAATPFVVDLLLYDPHYGRASDGDERPHVRGAFHSFWEHTIEPALAELRDPESADEEYKNQIDLLNRAVEGLDEAESQAHDTHHVRQLHGQTKPATRRLIQAKFNRPHAAPHVLVAQSRVGREGLNLHESCRVVIQFNAEWNPAILEQQIGRVDRKNSLWEQQMVAWLANKAPVGDAPFIEVRQLVFDGTYDAFQWETVKDRQYLFDATLYGELLPAAKLAALASEERRRLVEAAPDFRPVSENRPDAKFESHSDESATTSGNPQRDRSTVGSRQRRRSTSQR